MTGAGSLCVNERMREGKEEEEGNKKRILGGSEWGNTLIKWISYILQVKRTQRKGLFQASFCNNSLHKGELVK